MTERTSYDVVILGAGLAGLTLARHLLLETDRTVLLLEKRSAIPPERQKVGESLVQLAGHYFAKVLDLEEYLLREHFMKYNLRFYWKSGAGPSGPRAVGAVGSETGGSRFEEYSQSYIRSFSNVASYQLDRNRVEAELLRRNREDDRFDFRAGVSGLDVALARAADGAAPHRVAFEDDGGAAREVEAGWVVDTTGRGRFLARRMELTRPNPIRHGAFFWWVDGAIDLDKLTDRSPREIRLKPERRHQGHLPLWLATNHFMGEGFWFWVIPLQGKTSLGLVFDRESIDPSEVFSVDKATEWVCREFPLFARDLPARRVLDFGGFRDFSYDCVQTISPERWALAGEAGRFSDPLYSPGSDLIAVHNTLIVAAIETSLEGSVREGDADELAERCRLSEQIMRAVYGAYVPSYADSYDALGDQEVFSLKYVWELSIYFGFYVFPFLNELFTDRRFGLAFLRQFSRLGPINRGVQSLLSDFYRWKKARAAEAGSAGGLGAGPPSFFDFTEIGTLRRAEETFYRIGVSVEEAKQVLAEQVEHLEELARFLVAHAASVVLGAPEVVTNRRFVAGIELDAIRFDPEDFARRWALCDAAEVERWEWSFDPSVLDRFRAPERASVSQEVAR